MTDAVVERTMGRSAEQATKEMKPEVVETLSAWDGVLLAISSNDTTHSFKSSKGVCLPVEKQKRRKKRSPRKLAEKVCIITKAALVTFVALRGGLLGTKGQT